MSEQVQVCEGVWRTRDGREIVISLRDFGNAEPTSFVWFSKSTGEYETWRDDGRNTLSTVPQPLDLVEFLRPLPGTVATPEPKHVQVCEGVWLTRDGEHVEVRARDMTGNESSEWQWLGRRKNLLATWRNDGTLNASREQSNGDLVQFLRPLPATETTTEQLAEIEAGMAEIEKDVAELVQQDEASRLQAELVLVTAERETLRADLTEVASERDALVREINEATAERDRLQRELADMTKHSVELLESGQQARDQRDLLAQRLMTKPSEEFLRKSVARQQIEINTLEDQLQDMTAHRDQSAREVLRVTADRDGLLQLRDRLQATLQEQRQAIESARAVQQQLAAMTTERDRLQARVRDLEIEIDAAGQQPAPADRSEQIERIWDESRERAVSEIIELVIPLQVATGTHAESVLQILPAVIRRWMDGGGCDDAE